MFSDDDAGFNELEVQHTLSSLVALAPSQRSQYTRRRSRQAGVDASLVSDRCLRGTKYVLSIRLNTPVLLVPGH